MAVSFKTDSASRRMLLAESSQQGGIDLRIGLGLPAPLRGRAGRPRVVVERYVCLGDGADATADWYLHHYDGDDYFDAVRADTPTTVEHLEREIARLADAGCDDLVLLPCDADLRQVERIAGMTSAETRPVPA